MNKSRLKRKQVKEIVTVQQTGRRFTTFACFSFNGNCVYGISDICSCATAPFCVYLRLSMIDPENASSRECIYMVYIRKI